MSSASPREWEVWHARFNFSEGKGYKFRPVIVLGRSAVGNLVMMVTGSENKLHLRHDYLIRDWEAAGLVKPSIARADRIIEIPPDYLGTAGLIGRLSEADIQGLTVVLNEMIDEFDE